MVNISSNRKSLAWSFSQEGIQKTVRFIGSIFVARLLTPDEVGVFSIAMAAHFLLNAFQDFGVGTFLVREPNLTNDKVRTVFGLSLAIQWSLGVVLLLFCKPLADIYGEPGIVSVLMVVAISFFVGPFGQPASALLRRDLRFDILHHIGVTAVIIGTSTTILLAILGFSYMSMAWGLLTGNLTRAVLSLLVRPDHLRLRPGYRHWREILNFGGWLTAAGFAMTATTEGAKFMLGGLLTPGSVALVERAEQIPRLARQALFLPIGRVLIPSFSKDIREGKPIGASVETYVAALTAILWPMALTLSFISVPITLFLFGENWLIAGEILPYLFFGMAIRSALPTPNEILIPHGLVKRLTAVRVFQFIITISIGTVGALHSIEMFAIAQIPIAIIFVLANFISIRRYWGSDLRNIIVIYNKAALIALICSIPCGILYLYYGHSAPLPISLISGFSAIPIWFLCIYIFSHPLYDECKIAYAFLRKQLGRKG